jgi:hypothetical protein
VLSDAILISLSLFICYYILYKYQKNHHSNLSCYFLHVLFTFKLFSALFFLYVYTYHYGGGELTADAGRFFEESKVLKSVFHQDPKIYFQFLLNWSTSQEMIDTYLEATSHWNASERLIPNDSRNVIRINSVLLFISNGNIFIHFIFFSFITFIAGLDLAQFIKKHSSLSISWIILALTLTPSIAFWGSSIIKEPFLIAGLMILIRGLFDDLTILNRILRIVLGCIFMSLFKPYILFIFLPFIVLYLLLTLLKDYSRLIVIGSYFLLLITVGQFTGINQKALFLISKQQEDFINLRDGGLYLIDDSEHYIYVYYTNRSKFEIKDGYATLNEPVGAFYMKANENFNRTAIQLKEIGKSWKIGVSLEETGSGVATTPINNSGFQLIKNIPSALLNTLIRPFPWDSGSWLKHLAFLENLLLLFLLTTSIIYRRIIKSSKIKNMIIVLSLFSIAILLVVGWTTPVLGAVVRYKVPATLIIVLLILLFWNKKIKKGRVNV